MECVYRDPGILNVISEEQLSLLFSDIIRRMLSKTPFRITCVVKYNQLYEKVTGFLLKHLYNLQGADKWAEVVGSYAENTCIESSDVDFLHCFGHVFCDPKDIDPRRIRSLLVQTKDDRIPPGCCWLRIFDQRTDFCFLEDCKERNGLEWFLKKAEAVGSFECNATAVDGHTHYPHKTKLDKIICYRPAMEKRSDGFSYFSSRKFSEFHLKSGLTPYKIINKLLPNWSPHGPAHTQKYFGRFAVDITNSLRCDTAWPESASEWQTRERLFNWPPEETIREIISLGFEVVAIPSRVSSEEYNDIEWRLSFGRATEKLVLTFNTCQKHCYVILKLIVKQFIESYYPNTDFISSYIMKTVIFWTIEETPSYTWEEKNLMHCLRLCLLRLSKWVRDRFCPNYFITKYNLFRTKLDDMDKLGFCQWLLQSLERDWAILLECEAFKQLKEKWNTSEFNEHTFSVMLH